jgi:hypothetical protein
MFACHYFDVHQVFNFYSKYPLRVEPPQTIWKYKRNKVIYIGRFPKFWTTSSPYPCNELKKGGYVDLYMILSNPLKDKHI